MVPQPCGEIYDINNYTLSLCRLRLARGTTRKRLNDLVHTWVWSDLREEQAFGLHRGGIKAEMQESGKAGLQS